MAKLINTESYIVFMDPKFYRHEHMTKIQFYKNSQNLQARKLFITIKAYLTSIKSKKYLNRSKKFQTWETAMFQYHVNMEKVSHTELDYFYQYK